MAGDDDEERLRFDQLEQQALARPPRGLDERPWANTWRPDGRPSLPPPQLRERRAHGADVAGRELAPRRWPRGGMGGAAYANPLRAGARVHTGEHLRSPGRTALPDL